MKVYSSSSFQQQNKGRAHYYKKPFRKTKGFYILGIIVIVVIIFIAWSIKRSDNEISNEEPKFSDQEGIPNLEATVSFLEGTLELKSADTDWSEIGADYQIKINDSIKTGTDTKAIISLPDQSLIRLSSNTQLFFQEMGMADVVIEQIHGRAFHRVNDQSTAIYRVKHDKIELTALGTGFSVTADSDNTKVMVTESKVKAKIYQGDDIINMRTIEQGTFATIDTTKELNQMIDSEEMTSEDLMSNEWYVWNFEQDSKQEFFLGIFEKAVKLVITEPEKAEFETDQNKFTLKGVTDPSAEIFVSGKELDNNDGSFESEIALSSGDNEIEITVKKGKNKNKKTLNINSTYKEGSITLSAEAIEKKASLTWQTEGLDDFKEFIVLMAKGTTPSYPDSTHHSLKRDIFEDEWSNLEDGEYSFRICALSEEDSCLTYSSIVKLTISEEEEKPDDPPVVIEDLILTATADGSEVNLNWTGTINSEIDSLKVVIAQTANPVYPGNSFHSFAPNQQSDSWKDLTAGTYYFRVCLIQNGGCAQYSNQAQASIAQAVTTLGTIFVTGEASANKINLSWQVYNMTSPQGFKVIMSEQPGITFPGQSHHLVLNASATSDEWVNLQSGKSYYFKVCETVGSDCGIYSNELKLDAQ